MDHIKSLFLQNQSNPTVKVNDKEHIFRSKVAKDGFVSTPLYPKLNKADCSIDKVWKHTVDSNGYKPVFGNRDLIKVSKYLFFCHKNIDLLVSVDSYQRTQTKRAWGETQEVVLL